MFRNGFKWSSEIKTKFHWFPPPQPQQFDVNNQVNDVPTNEWLGLVKCSNKIIIREQLSEKIVHSRTTESFYNNLTKYAIRKMLITYAKYKY